MSEEIIAFTSEHLDACANLLVQVFNNEPWNEPWTFKTARILLLQVFNTPGFVGFVLLGDSEIIGFIVGYCEQSCNHRRFFLREICVHSDKQRQGIGAKLVRQLIDTLSTMNINLIYLLTMKDGELKNFYTKSGFHQSPNTVLMLQEL